MEYLEVPFEFEDKAGHTNDEEDPMFKVSGYASTFKNTDLVNDIIVQGAFANSLKRKGGKKIKMLWQHRSDMPIGKVTSIKEDDKGLFIKAVLPKDHSTAADVISLIKNDIIDSMSIGFTVNDAEFIKGDKRKLKEITLHEISFVTFPANPQAQITAFKSLGKCKQLTLASRDAKWNSEDAEARIAEFTSTTNNYKDAFLCAIPGNHNDTDIKSFDCRLLFADVIDNELKAIPNAIFRAAALIKGGLETEIPESNIEEVKSAICNYYRKMGLEDPFATTKFHAEELDVLTKRELEQILRDSGLCLTKAAATRLVSCLDWNRSESDNQTKQQGINFICSSIINMTEMIKNGC